MPTVILRRRVQLELNQPQEPDDPVTTTLTVGLLVEDSAPLVAVKFKA